MLITILLILISILFNLIKVFYVKLFYKVKFQTLPGYLLLKFKIDFVNLYLSKLNRPIILVTGTNGKTSTTHLLCHILSSQNIKVLTNKSGSNLKRGILSSLVLSYISHFKRPYDLVVLEVDEGSVLEISKSIPKNIKDIYLILLNLSRDQLDRYGEVDIIASKINEAAVLKNIKVITKPSIYTENFVSFTAVEDSLQIKHYSKLLSIDNSPHLIENLKFVLTLLNKLNIAIDSSTILPFNLVAGRGNTFQINGLNFELHLSKNPASFENNLDLLIKSKALNVLIVMNDGIPDGRDVSWFYDIDSLKIRTALNAKNVFVAGSRSYDFYNLLKILNIPAFNALNFNNYLKHASLYNLSDTFLLSNYSATVSISNITLKK